MPIQTTKNHITKENKRRNKMSNDYYPGEQMQEINGERLIAQCRSNDLFATESAILYGHGTAVSWAALRADGSLS
jgi:hypothetical protein